jgi:quercetin dioxygenase-like cupin family protein
MIVLRGTALAEVEGRQYRLQQYDALFVPSAVNHAVRNDSNEEAHLHVSFPNAAPDRVLTETSYQVEPREATTDTTPEKLVRFAAAEEYELAPNTAFRDLFTKRLGSSGVCGGYGRFRPGSSLPCHIHDYDESISIVEGEAICQVAGEEHALSGNDTACIPRGRPHRFINRSDQAMAMIWVYAGDQPDREIVPQCHCAEPPQT